MLFHLGGLRRINDAGLLGNVDRFSTVSGGAIAGAVLALNWPQLDFVGGRARRFELVENAIFELAGHTLDLPSVLVGLLPGTTPAKQLARRYDRVFGARTTLQDLPDEPPRFLFCATNMVTGNLFRLAKLYAADYQLGRIRNPVLRLAEAVAASSAFPPFLSPLQLSTPGSFIEFGSDATVPNSPRVLWLTDGGVYDNLALQPVESYGTVLVSDGGAPFPNRREVGRHWPSQALRLVTLLDEQTRRIRRRQFVSEIVAGTRTGALWTISTDIARFPVTDVLPAPVGRTTKLALVPTRLARLPVRLRHRLANWGYAAADAAIRSYVLTGLDPPSRFPYPDDLG